MVISSKRQTHGIEAPTLTIVARNNLTKIGWRSNLTHGGRMESQCKEFTNGDIDRCVFEKTYNKTEFIKDVLLGYETKCSLMDQTPWVEDFTDPRSGRSYSLTIPRPLSKDPKTPQLQI